MAPPFVKFDLAQARRIAASVRAFERKGNDAGSKRPIDPGERRIPNVQFTVRVFKDGGSAGSAAVDCSWTYTVKTCSGRELATAMTPTRRRIPLTQYSLTPDGADGTAYFDEAGELVLLDANEVPSTEDC